MPIQLTEKEIPLFERLLELVRAFRETMSAGVSSKLMDEIEHVAAELDRSLRARGQTPVHHQYMIENRGCQPNEPGFYRHLHPVEDLIAFVRNPRANVDPVDQTIGWEGEFKVYSRRWKHDDTYRIKRTASGWTFTFMSGPAECDKSGHPYFFEALRHDSIQYPHDLGGWLEWLWDRARDEGMTPDQLQAAVQELADWVSGAERSAPSGGLWGGYA